MEDKSPPKKLSKYYKCDENGCSALLNNYLWASHPLQFNDPFDCAKEFFDLDCFNNESIKEWIYPELVHLFENKPSDEMRRGLFYEMLSLGIVCLNKSIENGNEILWGYYSNQEGFLIEFNTQVLIKSFDDNLPIKVKYLTKREIAGIKKYRPCDLGDSLTQWATTKKKMWKNDEEWRFLFMDTFGYNTIYKKGDITLRQKKYTKDSISKVVLGYKFFNEQIVSHRKYKISENTFKFEFNASDNKYKWNILDYLFKNETNLYQVFLNEKLQLVNIRIKIESIKEDNVVVKYCLPKLK